MKAVPDCPFMVFTGQPTTQAAMAAYQAGALDYRAKDLRAE